MIQVAPQMRILVAIEAVDLRKGIDGLAQLCREKLGADPFSGSVPFVGENDERTLVLEQARGTTRVVVAEPAEIILSAPVAWPSLMPGMTIRSIGSDGSDAKMTRFAPARRCASISRRRRYRPVASTTQSTFIISHGTSSGRASWNIRVRNFLLVR